uniref:Putative secreted protein n=1 Tax=Amblyomma cajennense TaxID=34607 RepID=A0A023FR14_AMBCJ
MMWSLCALVAVSFVGMASAFLSTTDSSCDFTHIDLDGAVDKLLAKFPEYHFFGPQSFAPLFAGLEIGGRHVRGLNGMRRYGPLLPYCVNGTRMLQLDLITSSDTELSTPWRHCSGSEGSIKLRQLFTRLTTQFRVNLDESRRNVVLSHEGPTLPVTTEGLVLVLEGAGDIAKQAIGGLSLAFGGALQLQWASNFYPNFAEVVKNALDNNTL